MQPFGITLRPVPGVTWTPVPSAPHDLALMELATRLITQKNPVQSIDVVYTYRLIGYFCHGHVDL
jgi:hypothetical protein